MLRAYFFGNYYLSHVQHGVQSVHTVSEMFVKYKEKDNVQSKTLYDWAENGKTVVFLNGGNSGALQTLKNMFLSEHNPFPWSSFHEDTVSLNGALTNVGIVLPECLAKANDEKPVRKLMSEFVAEIEKYCKNLEYAYQLMLLVQSGQLIK